MKQSIQTITLYVKDAKDVYRPFETYSNKEDAILAFHDATFTNNINPYDYKLIIQTTEEYQIPKLVAHTNTYGK